MMGSQHRMDGINVIGNSFQLFGGSVIDRVEALDESLGSFDLAETRDLLWEGNSYGSVTARTRSPLLAQIDQDTLQSNWNADLSRDLPFGGYAMGVDNVTAHGPIRDASNSVVWSMPHVLARQGSGQNNVELVFPQPVRGTVQLKVRVDRAD